MEFENFLSSKNEKLDSLLKFSALIDKMTSIKRQTLHIDESERENDAEHSWHIATMALLFEDFALEKVDVNRAVKMCLVHDLVEIYAGDTFAYDEKANLTKKKREKEAANKIFSELPKEMGKNLCSLWEEFDEAKTSDAKYARCMDNLQPFLHNVLTNGRTWKEHSVHKNQVEKRMKIIKDFMPQVYFWIEKNLESAVLNGFLKDL